MARRPRQRTSPRTEPDAEKPEEEEVHHDSPRELTPPRSPTPAKSPQQTTLPTPPPSPKQKVDLSAPAVITGKFVLGEAVAPTEHVQAMHATAKAFMETCFSSYLRLGDLDMACLRQLFDNSDTEDSRAKGGSSYVGASLGQRRVAFLLLSSKPDRDRHLEV
ncbi:unnamed protein product [Lactuca saligna]|uniref:Uncharacterized protein n=1 Tax=Lactuca saligna TaxID=75948 RepID=A0AA35VPE6_LACSI|nr:unnamed protein product [Lactuca saligna]